MAELSEDDVESMEEGELELVVAINDVKKKMTWDESDNILNGTIGRYRIDIAGYYIRKSDGELMQYRILCPYAVGFDYAFD
jgi:hypothetical protein